MSDPTDLQHHLEEGLLNFSRGMVFEAREAWRRVLQVNRNHPVALDYIESTERELNAYDRQRESDLLNNRNATRAGAPWTEDEGDAIPAGEDDDEEGGDEQGFALADEPPAAPPLATRSQHTWIAVRETELQEEVSESSGEPIQIHAQNQGFAFVDDLDDDAEEADETPRQARRADDEWEPLDWMGDDGPVQEEADEDDFSDDGRDESGEDALEEATEARWGDGVSEGVTVPMEVMPPPAAARPSTPPPAPAPPVRPRAEPAPTPARAPAAAPSPVSARVDSASRAPQPAPASRAPQPAPAARSPQPAPAAEAPTAPAGSGWTSTSSRIEALLSRANARLKANQREAALDALSSVLELDPDHAIAISMRKQVDAELIQEYEKSLGSSDGVPTLVISSSELMKLDLDEVGGYVLSRIDGMLTLDDIYTLSANIDRLTVMRILADLVKKRVIAIE